MNFLVEASNSKVWREYLNLFSKVDVCQLPEFHLTYQTRFPGATPYLWGFQESGHTFCYPFYLTPVTLKGEDGKIVKTPYFDLSSVYGYSGPISTNPDKAFISRAWASFDEWCKKQKVIAEFIRFSLYLKNQEIAHPNTKLEANRPSAVSYLPKTEEELMSALNSKTRNMIRKAQKSNLVAKEVSKEEGLSAFKELYATTMERNKAPGFFIYDNNYFDLLFSMSKNEVKLFGTFLEGKMIASAIAILYQKNALYHLGASLIEYSNLGAGNLVMFEMSKSLAQYGVEFLTVGGGRTTAENDPLYLFKRNNATNEDIFTIGKRVVDEVAYGEVLKEWKAMNKKELDSPNLIFYR